MLHTHVHKLMEGEEMAISMNSHKEREWEEFSSTHDGQKTNSERLIFSSKRHGSIYLWADMIPCFLGACC